MNKKRIESKEVEKVAELSRLEVKPEKLELFASQLNEIIGYMDTLTSLEVEGVEPLTHVLDLSNVTHPDQVVTPPSNRPFLDNAPQTRDGFFIVPTIID